MMPEDILNLARRLLEDVDLEDMPMLNAAIGRAYYSCFHKLKDVAQNTYNWNECDQIRGGVHEKMISRIDNHNLSDAEKIKVLFSIKKDIITLKKKRVNADYYINATVNKLGAEYCVATAEKIIKRLDSI